MIYNIISGVKYTKAHENCLADIYFWKSGRRISVLPMYGILLSVVSKFLLLLVFNALNS